MVIIEINNRITKIILVSLVIISLASTQITLSSSIEASNEKISEYTHSVLLEACTGSTCPPCAIASEVIHDVYSSGSYDFYYVSLVWNENSYAEQRLREYRVTGIPDYVFDGGYDRYVGASGIPSNYISRLNSCGSRSVADINLDMDVIWQENSKIEVNIDIKNNKDFTYKGELRVYVTEIESRWNTYSGKPYHFAMIGNYAIYKNLNIPAKDDVQYSNNWDGKTYGLSNLASDNIMVIAAVYRSTTNHVDKVVGLKPTTSSPPNVPDKPTGSTSGDIGTEYSFSTSTTDPENDRVYYQWNWGDKISEWIGPLTSGEIVTAKHTWPSGGSYAIKVRSKDENGATSDYSEPLNIDIAGSRLKIGLTSGGFGKLCTEIINTGNVDAENIEWNISVKGGFLNRIDINSKGKIDNLLVDGKKSICIDKPIRGFGKIEISITANADGIGQETATIFGRIFLFYVIITP